LEDAADEAFGFEFAAAFLLLEDAADKGFGFDFAGDFFCWKTQLLWPILQLLFSSGPILPELQSKFSP